MRILFFFVHPSKYHVFKHTINALKEKGHRVDITITSKDVLEELVRNEGWEYTNIFPEGRKIEGIPTKLGAAINLFKTIYRLDRFTRGKEYDLFITDDLLVCNGKFRKTPAILFQDDDISAVPETALLLSMATHVLSPRCTKMGRYSYKKIGFDSYKELAYLHPNNFSPDYNVVLAFNPNRERYFIIRLVVLKSVNDVGKLGIADKNIVRLLKLLQDFGRVYISSERGLPNSLEKYRLNIKPNDIAHALYYADLFISDSQTMSSEASVLGTPAFRLNDFVGEISVMEEKEKRYNLCFGYRTGQFDKMYEKIEKMLNYPNMRGSFERRRRKMLTEKIDLTQFLIWFAECYPKSSQIMVSNPDYQVRFK
mgnify:CR=1 FL=1